MVIEEYKDPDHFAYSQVAGGQTWNNWDDWRAYNLDATFTIPSGGATMRPCSVLIRPAESTLAYDLGMM